LKSADALVLGAGIVGVSVALHLQKRGRATVLVDRRGAADVDAQHPRLRSPAIGASRRSRGGEDRAGVAVARAVGELERCVEIAADGEGVGRRDEATSCRRLRQPGAREWDQLHLAPQVVQHAEHPLLRRDVHGVDL